MKLIMQRSYANNISSSTVTKFIGTEVEKSPAYGLRTLFVTSDDCQYALSHEFDINNVNHVYLNANHSDPFNIPIHVLLLLQQNLNVKYMTIEVFTREEFELIANIALEFDKILIMWSVAIPDVLSIGNRVTIKLDDSTFNHSNPGVYCMSALEFITNSHETKWNEYTQDTPI